VDDEDEQEEDPIYLPNPTDAPPGSQEKVEVLRKRFENGPKLWHPDDRTEVIDVGI
jgi:hypothetical protein